MPIDRDKVVGAELAGGTATWELDDVILYHLGLGAGVPATDPNELAYTYESQLKVLPSFGVVPVFGTLAGMVILEGVSVNPMMILHGEQSITIHNPLPTSAKVENSGRVVDVFDKGKGALLIAETDTKDDNGNLLCTNRFSIFARGEGGFGGPSGPPPGNQAPERERTSSSSRPRCRSRRCCTACRATRTRCMRIRTWPRSVATTVRSSMGCARTGSCAKPWSTTPSTATLPRWLVTTRASRAWCSPAKRSSRPCGARATRSSSPPRARNAARR